MATYENCGFGLPLGSPQPIAWLACPMCNRDDLGLVCLDQEMDHVIESSDDGETEIDFRSGKFAFGETGWVCFNP